ncbi:hypothetical protein OH76DRAFT_1551372 [Lentinus brumalis]|uniref:Uncharacterized protein n=1 Tax=Lentinus brumalis TaxID=2498619 RepID=A0A371DTG4_9APHY|nr:hypothetical protein OH76DRAFT_1551372 [Polyporus brumalis]
MNNDGDGGLLPPPSHSARTPSPGPTSSSSRPVPPPFPPRISPSPGPASSNASPAPPLPPRPSESKIVVNVDEGSESGSGSDEESATESTPTPSPESGASTTTLTTKDEEDLSEVQLRELYDDEEIDRFLHLFSTYVREVRAADREPVAQAASASAPAIGEFASQDTSTSSGTHRADAPTWDGSRSISERIAHDLLLPLLPAPRPPPPDFTIGRLKQTAQRLYVAVEPFYKRCVKPLLKLATWKDPRRSFVYCALYWILWYHGLLLSAGVSVVLYHLISRKLHPYPSLSELREYRKTIDRSQTFGTILLTRLATSPTLGLRDVWELVDDYRHIRKLKKAKSESAQAEKNELEVGGGAGLNDDAKVRSVSFSTPDLGELQPEAKSEQVAKVDEADLKRLGLSIMNEVADFLERIKNIFLWRQPGASAYYGVVLLGWLVVGLLPARYMVRLVGFFIGFFFWHVIPVVAAIPESERSRIPPPLLIVPTDTEYAMDLISQRVAHGLPVRPKRRKRASRGSSEVGVLQTEEPEGRGESSSVDWNKWGGRITTTKEKAGELKEIFRDGQWKQAGNWKAFNPLAPKVAAPPVGPETRIETQTFPAQLKKSPGLITLTPTTLFFTPLLASRPSVVVPLEDITGVKKTTFTKGIDVRYTQTLEDGSREEKAVEFMFVASRGDLFARLVSWGGRRWARV